MTPEQEKARDMQLAFREQLRQLCLAQYEAAQKAELPSTIAAGIVAEECMHMSAFFVTRGGTWSADTFSEECRKMYDWHKNVAIREQGRPN
jgi:hypothetical protein